MKEVRLADSEVRVTELGLKNGTRLAPKGAVLLLVRGSELHKRIPIGITTRSVAFNQDVKALVAKDSVLSEFVLYWLLANERMILSKVEFTGIGAGKLDTAVMMGLPLALPPFAEQQAIAHILGTLDDKIELNRRMNETLEAITHAIFKSWFVDFDPVRAKAEGRRPPGMDADTAALFPGRFQDSEPGTIPVGWSIQSVYQIADVTYGAPFASGMFNPDHRGMPLLRIRDLTTYQPEIFTAEDHPKATVINPGDIVVGMDGEFRVHHWRGEPVLLNQRVCTFRPKPGIPRWFVSASIVDPMEFFERSKVGTTVIHLGKSDIDTIHLIVPPRPVLEAFGQAAEPLLDEIIRNENESRTLAALRDALLPKLLSGEVRVENVERVVETSS